MQTDGSPLASFREIHKNAYLKIVPPANNNKLLPINQRKGSPERWWIVFCVHGDIEPYLEGYLDTSAATTHMPRWRTSLKHTLHVSGSVGPAKPHTEYEFVITLQDGVIRLIAPTWESMQDWVDTLRNKLREMKIVSPKENVYSKGPEQCKPRAPTRDPTSPLPAPPPGPIVRVPGTEPSIRPSAGSNEESLTINETSDNNPQGNSSTPYESTADRIAIEISDVSPTIIETVPDDPPIVRSEDVSSISVNSDVENDNLINRLAVLGEPSTSASNDDLDYIDDAINNISNENVEFLATSANVSGMNICLGDSLLEHRIKNEADKELFAEFDTYDANESTKISITDKDVKAKYSQVNISAKTSKSTTNIIASSSADNVIPIVDNTLESSSTTCIVTTGNVRVKPQVKPRTIVPVSILSSVAVNEIEPESMQYDNASGRMESNKIKEKPKVIERKKIPYNRSQSSKEFYTNTSPIDTQDNENAVTNVTIITVSNHLNHRSASDSSQSNETDKQTVKINSNNCTSERNYINYPISFTSETNHNSLPVYLEGKAEDKVVPSIAEDGIVFRGVSSLEVNSNNNKASSTVLPSPGYGHIRHSTTIGVPPPETTNSFQTPNIPSTSRVTTFDISADDSILNSDRKQSFSTNQSINISCKDNNKPQAVKVSQKATISINKPETSNQSNEGETSNRQAVNRAREDFYESVFTPTPRNIQVPTDDTSNKPGSSSFYIGQHNLIKPNVRVTNNNKNQTEYEFLSWNGSNISNGNSQTHVNAEHQRVAVESNERIQESNNSNSNHMEVNPLAARRNTKEDISSDRPRGLFTRGLTELSIMSRFRNMSHLNSSRSPLLKNSQFYSYEEVDPAQGTSTDNQPDNVKKNKHFADKFNLIFGKHHDDKSGKDKLIAKSSNPCDRVKIESSLRRNWSEHNDRTVLPMVKHALHLKEKKTRTPLGESSSQNVSISPSIREEQQLRRRSNSFSEGRTVTNENSSATIEAPKPTYQNNMETVNAPLLLRPMGLREQQVAKLRGEMAHAGGVRLRLRSGDCPGEAMAMADAYGTVWVCGWKQKTHPLLYNALHIGDRLATVGGVPITSVRQAKRALKDTTSGLHYVELVIKRLPHGRVYALKKDSDSQELGLITECANIVSVLPGSPAALGGVPANGTLTEINGRPLNLLLKKGDTQVRDRLNAIGREVSILVQPTEFVMLLRKSLSSIRSHKDYIVQ